LNNNDINNQFITPAFPPVNLAAPIHHRTDKNKINNNERKFNGRNHVITDLKKNNYNNKKKDTRSLRTATVTNDNANDNNPATITIFSEDNVDQPCDITATTPTTTGYFFSSYWTPMFSISSISPYTDTEENNNNAVVTNNNYYDINMLLDDLMFETMENIMNTNIDNESSSEELDMFMIIPDTTTDKTTPAATTNNNNVVKHNKSRDLHRLRDKSTVVDEVNHEDKHAKGKHGSISGMLSNMMGGRPRNPMNKHMFDGFHHDHHEEGMHDHGEHHYDEGMLHHEDHYHEEHHHDHHGEDMHHHDDHHHHDHHHHDHHGPHPHEDGMHHPPPPPPPPPHHDKRHQFDPRNNIDHEPAKVMTVEEVKKELQQQEEYGDDYTSSESSSSESSSFEYDHPYITYDNYNAGVLGYGAEGDLCMYNNYNYLSQPCINSIQQLSDTRAEYWEDYNETTVNSDCHFAGGFAVLLLGFITIFAMIRWCCVRKRIKHERDLLTSINANPMLKASVEAETGIEVPKPRESCLCNPHNQINNMKTIMNGEGTWFGFMMRIIKVIIFIAFIFITSIFITISSLEITATIVDHLDENAPVVDEETGEVSLTSPMFALFILTSICVLELTILAIIVRGFKKCYKKMNKNNKKHRNNNNNHGNIPHGEVLYSITPSAPMATNNNGYNFTSMLPFMNRNNNNNNNYMYQPLLSENNNGLIPTNHHGVRRSDEGTEMVAVMVPTSAVPVTNIHMV